MELGGVFIPCADPNCKLEFTDPEEALEHGKSHSTADDVIHAHLPVSDIVERTEFTALPVTNLQGLDAGRDFNFNHLLRVFKKDYIQKLREDEEAEKLERSKKRYQDIKAQRDKKSKKPSSSTLANTKTEQPFEEPTMVGDPEIDQANTEIYMEESTKGSKSKKKRTKKGKPSSTPGLDASVGDLTGFANSEEVDISIIFLEALKKEHACYLEALSASNDEFSSGKRLENMASQLASLAAGREELTFKVINSGIDFTFTDVPRHISFFTHAVMQFVLQLPRANITEILKNLDNQAQSVNTDVDASGWSSYFACVNTLREYCSNEADDDFVLNLATPSGAFRIPIQQIGIEGERAAFDYLSSTFSDKTVTWLNSDKESHFPYDIILEAADQTLEYVEVKSTTVEDKNWFQLKLSQWEFALEKGEAFTVAHVFLSEDAGPTVTIYRNIVQLVKSHDVKLICLPKKRPFSLVSN